MFVGFKGELRLTSSTILALIKGDDGIQVMAPSDQLCRVANEIALLECFWRF